MNVCKTFKRETSILSKSREWGKGGRGLCYLRNYGAMRTKINVRFTPYGIHLKILATQCYMLLEIHSKHYLMLSEKSNQNNNKCY